MIQNKMRNPASFKYTLRHMHDERLAYDKMLTIFLVQNVAKPSLTMGISKSSRGFNLRHIINMHGGWKL